MNDNSADPNTKRAKAPFETLTVQYVAEGVVGGVVAFMIHNRVNLHPARKSQSPIKDFTGKLLTEYVPNGSGYPYPESFKAAVEAATLHDIGDLRRLYDADDMVYLRGYCHMIGATAVAEFLEKYREPTLKLILDIRGEETTSK